MKIGLAQTRFPRTIREGIDIVIDSLREAAIQNCELVCFPESIIPGLRGVGYAVEEYDHTIQSTALAKICEVAKELRIAVILPMEWKDELGLHLVAFVINENGEILGYQTKNQMDPEEDFFGYQPGTGRLLFEIKGVKLGVVICHEGWRYPETVRWAALREAVIVFHPQFTGEVSNPEFYNGAMICRSLENNLYFASVNYALQNQLCTTSLISPTGERLCAAQANTEELINYEIDPSLAHRLLAQRFHPNLLK